MQNSRHSIMW